MTDINCDNTPMALATTYTTIPIEAYWHQIEHDINSTLIELYTIWKSQRIRESRVSDAREFFLERGQNKVTRPLS